MNIHKELVKGMFSKENINEQLVIVKQKGLNWADLSNPAKSDVNVSKETARNLLDKVKDRLDISTCTLGDTSCGNAEIQVVAKEEYGVLTENMFVADSSKLNITIAEKRLNGSSGFKYEKSKEGVIAMTTMLEENKVDIEVTNDPFRKDSTNSDQLYPIMMHSSPARIKTRGYRVCIDPPTWTSGTRQVTDAGRVNLLEFFTTEHNLLELDYSVNNDFPGIGSQFVTSVIQIGVAYGKETKITTVDGDIFYVDLSGVKALPDSKQISEHLVKLFIAMQRKPGEKFYFKYCSQPNKEIKSADYTDTKSKDTPFEYVNASSNHGNKFAKTSNIVANNFVHSAYMGSKFKFDYFLNTNDISVMSNARVWINDNIATASEDILRSIFESELFNESVCTYKFTQYNECSFLNNVAIPPLDRIWSDEALREWYLNESK